MSFDPSTYGSQITGFDRQVLVSEKQSEAWANPASYLRKRTRALKELQTLSRTEFQKHYNAFRAQQFSEAESKERAEKRTRAVMASAISDFNDDWPQSVSDIAASLSNQKANAGVL